MTEFKHLMEIWHFFNTWVSANRVLVTLVTTLSFHLFAIAWWASSVTNRLGVIETWVSDNRALPLYLHRLDERTKSIKEIVERLQTTSRKS